MIDELLRSWMTWDSFGIDDFSQNVDESNAE